MENQKHYGLSEEQVIASRENHGSNKLTKKRSKSLALSFLENLGDPVIKVLLIALAVNVLFTYRNIDWFETGGIAVAILLSATISTLSERSSRAAFDKLNESVGSDVARVKRASGVQEITIDEVVVDDLVLLCAGDKVCADGYLISGSISLDQSAMTGESKESKKSPIKNGDSVDLSPSSYHSCLRGCLVSSGEGEMRVSRVGDSSFLGGIVNELQEETRESPLKIRLSKLAKQISLLGYGAAVVIALLSLFSSLFIQSDFVSEVIFSKLRDPAFLVGEILHSLTLGLTVVIMAVPEGLPMMIAVVLSSNVKKMLADNVLCRKQTGIEAAGSMNILFTDKTGTLTKGKMKVVGFILPDGSVIDGIYEFRKNHPDLFTHFSCNALYNSSAILSDKRISGGNPTEHALLEALKRVTPDYSRVTHKLPFDSARKYSSATYNGAVYLKGAPDVLLNRAERSSLQITSVERAISTAQSQGKRVIVMLKDNAFICAPIIADPLRREARDSVDALRGAGISTVMITGDGLLTAESIAKGAGIIYGNHNVCLTHSDIEGMSDAEIGELLPRLALLARALPQDKSRLVRIAQEKELVVGMTGDGINDASALKISDVGFAMGNGADVAKEAGDVVILDNNLASIVKAVLYGRNIFKSIRKFLVFQLTMNFSSALVCMIAPLLGYDTPITVSQMLWVNMIMDTLGGLAFAGEAAHKRIMREKPKRRDEPILNKYMIHQILISGGFSVLISMLFLKSPFFTAHIRESKDDLILLSAFFGLFIFLGVMQCINSRTDRLNPFNGLSLNPTFILIMILISLIQVSFIYFGGSVLRATPLLRSELLFTVACASLAIPAELIRKIIWRFSGHSEGF